MNVALLGDIVPKELIRAINATKYTIVGKPISLYDTLVLSGNKKKDIVRAQQSLEAGQPVFYTNTNRPTAALESLIVTAGNTNTPFYVVYNRRFSPVYGALAGQIQAGKVGKVGFVKIHSNLPVPRNYSPGKAGSCSTLVTSEMVHDIDWLNYSFGPTKKVFCQGTQKPHPATEYAMASITLKNGVIAQVVHSYQKTVVPSLRVEVCGTEGIVQYDSTEETIRQTPRRVKSETTMDGSNDLWTQHWLAFETLVAKGKWNKKETRSFVTPIRIAELTIQSLLSGEPRKV